MSWLVPATLLAWPLVILGLFAFLTPRRAILVALIGGFLFLPEASMKLPGLAGYSKAMATGIGVILGICIFDVERLKAFRLTVWDLPVVVWCLCPFPTSMLNGLGFRDGQTISFIATAHWFVPYFCGRLYFSDAAGLRDLAMGIVVGGLVYVPLCLLEVRLSPFLHKAVYGFHQHSFGQTKRFGGYRPMVFMQHGLMVAMWMAMATLVATVLWQAKVLRVWRGVPGVWLVAALAVTTVLCKSVNAALLLTAGAMVVYACRRIGMILPLVCLAMIVPTYVAARVTGTWSGDGLVHMAAGTVGAERAQSVAFRLKNEDQIREHAMEHPVFGWGGWGRMLVTDERGRRTIPDSMWIIALGEHGLVGLTSLFATLLAPVLLFVRRYRPAIWLQPAVASACALSVVLVAYAMDCLMNAMINPIFMLAAGAVTGFCCVVSPAVVRHGIRVKVRARPAPVVA